MMMKYVKPSIKVRAIDDEALLAASVLGTGDDWKWGAKRNNYESNTFEDYTVEDPSPSDDRRSDIWDD